MVRQKERERGAALRRCFFRRSFFFSLLSIFRHKSLHHLQSLSTSPPPKPPPKLTMAVAKKAVAKKVVKVSHKSGAGARGGGGRDRGERHADHLLLFVRCNGRPFLNARVAALPAPRFRAPRISSRHISTRCDAFSTPARRGHEKSGVLVLNPRSANRSKQSSFSLSSNGARVLRNFEMKKPCFAGPENRCRTGAPAHRLPPPLSQGSITYRL